MSRKEPKYDRLRGRHKKHASAETRGWNEKLPPPPPPWMDAETARKLYALRRQVEP